MKVRIPAGTVVRLAGGKTSSVAGGGYSLSGIPPRRRQAILAMKGVEVIQEPVTPTGESQAPAQDPTADEPQEPWEKVGLTLEMASAYTDEQLLSMPGIGPATVKKLRSLTEDSSNA